MQSCRNYNCKTKQKNALLDKLQRISITFAVFLEGTFFCIRLMCVFGGYAFCYRKLNVNANFVCKCVHNDMSKTHTHTAVSTTAA